ncbi:hypothetical protein J8J40_34280, partial [Mycobacterium tuberculosis]|nr:hypothetical protein [Mycobacterium tuberculosis]
LRQRSAPLRMAVSLGFVAALYVSHLYAVGVYGLAIAAYEIDAWLQRGRPFDRRLVGQVLTLGVPFLPVVPLLAASATW